MIFCVVCDSVVSGCYVWCIKEMVFMGCKFEMVCKLVLGFLGNDCFCVYVVFWMGGVYDLVFVFEGIVE